MNTIGFTVRLKHGAAFAPDSLARGGLFVFMGGKITHGQWVGGQRTRTFNSWQAMLNRCYNINNMAYHNYGRRGIIVCDEWRNSFEAFLKDMGTRPDQTTLDRKDDNGNYGPENCRWATNIEQHNNKRTNRIITINGISKTMRDWARHYGCDYKLARDRINRGIPPEEAYSSPVAPPFNHSKSLTRPGILCSATTKGIISDSLSEIKCKRCRYIISRSASLREYYKVDRLLQPVPRSDKVPPGPTQKRERSRFLDEMELP